MSKSPNQHIDQDQLVTELKAKDRDAFELLYENYSGAIFGLISRIVPDTPVAEEVLQDAFLKIWEKIDYYDSSKGRLFTWMANLSRNVAIDRLRSREIKDAAKTDMIENYVSSLQGSDRFDQQIDTIGLKEAMNLLREEERFLLKMNYFKGYSQSEISDVFNIPLGTVKTRMRMGLKNLRAVLNVK